MQADEKVEYRIFKQHMYGGPKGLGDPNYRHGFYISGSPFLIFCTCRDMSKMEEDPMIPQVQECRTCSTLDCHFLCSSLIFFSLQRMRDITRTQLCTKEVSAGHNLNLKSLSSVLSTTCTNLERRIVVFSNPIFRWPNFLNVPKLMDSPL